MKHAAARCFKILYHVRMTCTADQPLKARGDQNVPQDPIHQDGTALADLPESSRPGSAEVMGQGERALRQPRDDGVI